MTSSRMTTILAALALAVVLTGCKERRDPGFQGWVEADLIFVSPDEAGRCGQSSTCRGRRGEARRALYSVDDDCSSGPQSEQGDARQRAADLIARRR